MSKKKFHGAKTSSGVVVGYPTAFSLKHICNYPDAPTAERKVREKYGREIEWK